MYRGINVLYEFIEFALIYGITILIIFCFLKLFDKKLTKFTVLLPLCIIVFIFILIVIFEFTTDEGYSFFYITYASYLGLSGHIFILCLIYLLITLCAKNLKIWIGLIIILAIPLVLVIYGFIIPAIIKIDKKVLYYEGYINETLILQLSDIHLGAVYKKGFVKKIIKNINKFSPDIVVITGDFFDSSMTVKLDWIKPFDDLQMPILFTLGNHDIYYGKEKVLELVNQTKIQYINKKFYHFKGINFIGIDYDENLFETLDQLKDNLTSSRNPNVLLLHVPKKPKKFEDYNIFLSLSGHTHDGQIFPLNLFQYAVFECTNGLYKNNNTKPYTYVNSGVGGTFAPMRTFTRSKISLIKIQGK